MRSRCSLCGPTGRSSCGKGTGYQLRHSRLPRTSLAVHELREARVPFVLVKEGELVAIEGLEPVFPVDALERLTAAVARVVDAQHAEVTALAAGSLHVRGEAPARLDPFPDLVAIC